jgi:peptidylprolyl isomerase
MRGFIILTLVLVASAAYVFDAQAQGRRGRTSSKRTVKAAGKSAGTLSVAASVTTRTGLTYLITRRGTGKQAKAGETVIVHYTGTLTDGVKFDSSRDRNQPFAFKLGAGQVIKGWDEGIARLRVGDQAILVIPSQLGYGKKGAGGVIPPDATLIFIVELVDVKATSMAEMLSETLDARGLDAMITQYQQLSAAGGQDIYTSESDLNGLGYRLLAKKRIKEAIEVFKLNVAAYPQSANVYDSLAEAYLANGDKQQAIENYRKALELDPQSESAKKALRELTGK